MLYEKGVVGWIFFEFVFFDLITDYGVSPIRPLLIMGGIFFICLIPYMIALNTYGRTGIWQVWDIERVLKKDGQDEPIRLYGNRCRLRGFFRAMQFSLLSSFLIGWEDINPGNWIVRMQRHEYTLRATGLARTISGVQSLISVYLVALSVLIYFGRPF